MNSLNENIKPYQSCSKSVFLILGIILISWISLFSIFLIVQGAWPVSIFLGLEYLIIFYLIRLYFKEKNIKDEININQIEISIKKYKGDKLLHSSKFSTYWSKVFFTKFKNTFMIKRHMCTDIKSIICILLSIYNCFQILKNG